MLLVPVIDLLGGRAVHAVGGRRHEYRPVVSRLTSSQAADDLAAAMLEVCGGPFLYVADLDAIRGTGSNADLVARIVERTRMIVSCDAGLRTAADLVRFPSPRDRFQVDGGPPTIVGGLWERVAERRAVRHVRNIYPNLIPVWASETAAGPAALPHTPPAVFSVDLHAGRLLGDWAAWHADGVTHGEAVVEMAVAGQARTGAFLVVLLDLHSVGRSEGPAALAHCRAVRDALPDDVRLYVGGGVRGRDDLARLADAGASGAFVATAVHTGALP